MEEEIIGTTGKIVDLFNANLTQEEWDALCVIHRLTARLNVGIRFEYSKSIDVRSTEYSQIVDQSVFLSRENNRKEIDQQIVDLFEWIKEGDKDNSVLYMRGDNKFQTATLTIKGDVMLLAATFIRLCENNDDFGRFIFAVFGSYLAKTPDKLKEFMDGINQVQKQDFNSKQYN